MTAVEKHCQRHGPYMATSRTFGRLSVATNCPVCEVEAQDLRRQNELRQRTEDILAQANIPKLYSKLQPNELKPDIMNWVNQVPSHRSLVVMGARGNGKSSQCGSALVVLAKRGVRVSYRNCKETVEMLLATRGSSGERSFNAAVRDLVAPDILVLDDYVKFQEWQSEQLQAIVEARYREQRATVVATNLTVQQFSGLNLAASQTWDRLMDGGHLVLLTDPSFRVPASVRKN